MGPHVHHELLYGFLIIVGSLSHCLAAGSNYTYRPGNHDAVSLNRSSFPPGFLFGTSSAAYQYEGAAYEDGRGPSIWDYFTHKYPEKISDGSNGDVVIDQYHRYKEDVGIMKEIGLDAYRFSISWTRILPKGKLKGGINKEGVRYYNNLINELLAHGIRPFATLFHFDVPQILEEEYGGFLSPHVVDDFREYVDVCFKMFGDRVKHWITINEPWTFCDFGYATGTAAPGRCSAWQMLNCTGGDSGTEPYIVAHHLILAHAAAVKLYREKYQASQDGVIGITLVASWFVPYSNAKKDTDATSRALDFNLGWFLEPIKYGDYPHSMRALVGNRLPSFTKEQSLIVKGSFDFLGLNYYSSAYAKSAPPPDTPPSYVTDALVNQTSVRDGVPIGPTGASSWLSVYPRGIHDMLLYVKQKYDNPLIYITENGIDEFNNSTLPLEQQLSDYMRIDYHYSHLSYLREAIEDGVKVKGYFAWSLLDDFEWANGFTIRFGINYVDYQNGLRRIPKRSAFWFKSFLKKY